MTQMMPWVKGKKR